jgi:acid phosphatase family membrane protein YuiD
MMENWDQNKPDLFAEELKELIGHTWLQVIAGAVLGILIGVIGCLIWP